jgi:hypothetical protein
MKKTEETVTMSPSPDSMYIGAHIRPLPKSVPGAASATTRIYHFLIVTDSNIEKQFGSTFARASRAPDGRMGGRLYGGCPKSAGHYPNFCSEFQRAFQESGFPFLWL